MVVHRKIINDICSDCCPSNGNYCTLKEIVMQSGFNDRTLEQLKLVEIYKYEESILEGKDIGWNLAFKRWVDKGYAKKFERIYSDDLSHDQIYKLIMNEELSVNHE